MQSYEAILREKGLDGPGPLGTNLVSAPCRDPAVFIGKRVWTPKGSGVLLSVLADACELRPDGADRSVRVRAEDVKPIQ